MPQIPKRIPGEHNPEVDASEARLIQDAHNASAGAGAGDFGVGAAIDAWVRWRQRRKQRKAISSHTDSERRG